MPTFVKAHRSGNHAARMAADPYAKGATTLRAQLDVKKVVGKAILPQENRRTVMKKATNQQSLYWKLYKSKEGK